MALSIPLQSDPHAYDTRVTIDRVRYLFLLRWNWRSGDWRISVQDTGTGEWLATGRRISPGAMTVRFPHGELHAFGEDPYTRAALGDSLYVLYYPDSEIDDLKAAATPQDPPFALVLPEEESEI